MSLVAFPLLDRYLSVRLDAPLDRLNPGFVLVETARRLQRETSYGFQHVLWWVWLADGRSVLSLVPGAGACVSEITRRVVSAEHLRDPKVAASLREALNGWLTQRGDTQISGGGLSLQFACNAAHLQVHQRSECRRLRDASIPPAPGLELPTHCFPDGLVYGAVVDGCVASVAYAHRTGLMEDQVADIGIETAPDYRRRGLAQTALSAVATQMIGQGGEVLYSCGAANPASIATARSVGCVPYATSLVLSAPIACD